MSDLERLDEALDYGVVALRKHMDETLRVRTEAARAYRDLLANGERVEWCEAHRNEAWEDDRTLMRCIAGSWIEGANAWDCHIVPKLLVPVQVHLGEETQ